MVLRDCTARDACADRIMLVRIWTPRRIVLTVGRDSFREVHALPDFPAPWQFTALRYLPVEGDASRPADAYEGRADVDGRARTVCLWVTWEVPSYRIDLLESDADSTRQCADTPPPPSRETLQGVPIQRLQVHTSTKGRDNHRYYYQAEPPLPDQLPADAVARAFAEVEPLLRDCDDGQQGKVQIEGDVIRWLSRIADVKVAGASNEAVIHCIERALQFARFPLFAGPNQTITHTIDLSDPH